MNSPFNNLPVYLQIVCELIVSIKDAGDSGEDYDEDDDEEGSDEDYPDSAEENVKDEL